MKKYGILFLVILNAQLLFAQSNFIDNRDNRTYPTRKVGEAMWMISNLKYNVNYSSFYFLGADEVYYSSNQVMNEETCPDGWRIPSLEDWKKVEPQIAEISKDHAGLIKNGNIEGYGKAGAYWTSTIDSSGKHVFIIKADTLTAVKYEDGKSVLASCKCIKDE